MVCKAIEGVRDELPAAYDELRAHSHCNDCSIYGEQCKASLPSSRYHRKYEDQLHLRDVCSHTPRRADFDPPACVKRRLNGHCKLFYNGDDLVVGASEEDSDIIEARLISVRFLVPSYMEHFWNPDIGNGHLGFCADVDFGCPGSDQGMITLGGSYARAEGLFQMAVQRYTDGSILEGYYLLGRVAHLLSDLTVPAHVHGDAHPGPLGRRFAGSCEQGCGAVDGEPLENFLKSAKRLRVFDGVDVTAYRFASLLQGVSDFTWPAVSPAWVKNPALFRLFWFTAQTTQYLASSGDPALRGRCEAGDVCFAFARGDEGGYARADGSPGALVAPLWAGPIVLRDPCQVSRRLKETARFTVPHALAAVAGLYRLFWDATHDDDGDGFGVLTDCRPRDAGAHPDGDEICDDEVDNDCDGAVDCLDAQCATQTVCGSSTTTMVVVTSTTVTTCTTLPGGAFTIEHDPEAGCHPHFIRDIQLDFRPSFTSPSTLTVLTIHSVAGFSESVTLRMQTVASGAFRIEKDDNEDGVGDGVNVEIPNFEPIFIDAAGQPSVASITVQPPYAAVSFFVRVNSRSSAGRYVLFLEGITSSGARVSEELIFVAGRGTSGYKEI